MWFVDRTSVQFQKLKTGKFKNHRESSNNIVILVVSNIEHNYEI